MHELRKLTLASLIIIQIGLAGVLLNHQQDVAALLLFIKALIDAMRIDGGKKCGDASCGRTSGLTRQLAPRIRVGVRPVGAVEAVHRRVRWRAFSSLSPAARSLNAYGRHSRQPPGVLRAIQQTALAAAEVLQRIRYQLISDQ